MKQDFRTGQLDVLTAGELSKALHEHFHEGRFSRFFREEYKGMNIKRIPPLVATATGAGLLLNSPAGATPCGPESGFIWRVESLFLESSNTADAATAILYVGSDITSTRQIAEAERKGFLLGQRYYPSSKGLWVWPGEQIYTNLSGATSGNVYTLTGIVAEAPAEMKGKLL